MIRHARKIITAVIGFTVLLFGLLLLPTPAPFGWFLVPLGLVVLAGEFVWARRWLDRIQNNTGPVGRKMRDAEDAARRRAARLFGMKPGPDDTPPPAPATDGPSATGHTPDARDQSAARAGAGAPGIQPPREPATRA